MDQAQKTAYGETTLFRNIAKGSFLKYADEQIRQEAANQYTLIPGEPQLSQQYYQARVRVSQTVSQQPRSVLAGQCAVGGPDAAGPDDSG